MFVGMKIVYWKPIKMTFTFAKVLNLLNCDVFTPCPRIQLSISVKRLCTICQTNTNMNAWYQTLISVVHVKWKEPKPNQYVLFPNFSYAMFTWIILDAFQSRISVINLLGVTFALRLLLSLMTLLARRFKIRKKSGCILRNI